MAIVVKPMKPQGNRLYSCVDKRNLDLLPFAHLHTFHLLEINECEDGVHGCGGNTECLNTVGSYECVCKEGYAGQNCDGLYLRK